MEILFWISVFFVAATYFGYPVFLVIAASFMNTPVKKTNIFPSVSLLIPAYNEGKNIGNKLENSLKLNYPPGKLEIIVISDGSTDKTEDACMEYGAKGVKLIVQKERKGKMAALNRAVQEAVGEIIVFSDANTMYDPEAVRMLVGNFGDEKIGCACGNSVFKTEGKSSVESGFSAYMAYERFIWRKESQLKSLLVVDGAIYGIRKKLFSPIKETLADDFVNPLNIGTLGYGIVYEPEARAEEKAVSDIHEEFKRKIRVTSQGYDALLTLWATVLKSPLLRIFQYILHKLIRWMVPLFLILIFAANLCLLDKRYLKCIFIIQVIFYLAAIVGYLLENAGKRTKIFYIPFYFCLINIAAVAGLFRVLTGPQKGTWEKAETTR